MPWEWCFDDQVESQASGWLGKDLLYIANRECFPLRIPRKLAVLAIAKRLFGSLLTGTEVFCLRSSGVESQWSERGSLVTAIAERLVL
mmetsp:Transcript_12210/g.26211  ORF Transcript_12210/g.26211 Transcript_12210/m.26211 type:complete len:88 (-) Transcript_12210:64-327(-)